jgi:hypothetical protein
MRQGWTECSISIAGATLTLSVSYFLDALDDLLRAAAVIVSNPLEQTVIFTDEPGEYRLKLLPLGKRLRVRVLAFAELFSREPDSAGKLMLDAECRLRTFAGAVLSSAQTVLATHGRAGYYDLWRHEFPIDPMEKLRAALESS